MEDKMAAAAFGRAANYGYDGLLSISLTAIDAVVVHLQVFVYIWTHITELVIGSGKFATVDSIAFLFHDIHSTG